MTQWICKGMIVTSQSWIYCIIHLWIQILSDLRLTIIIRDLNKVLKRSENMAVRFKNLKSINNLLANYYIPGNDDYNKYLTVRSIKNSYWNNTLKQYRLSAQPGEREQVSNLVNHI